MPPTYGNGVALWTFDPAKGRLEPEFSLEFRGQQGGSPKAGRNRSRGNCYDSREKWLGRSQDAGGLLCEPTLVPTALSMGFAHSLECHRPDPSGFRDSAEKKVDASRIERVTGTSSD